MTSHAFQKAMNLELYKFINEILIERLKLKIEQIFTMPDSQQEYFDRLKNPKDYKKTSSAKTGRANQVLKSIQKSKHHLKSIITDS